MVVSFIKLLFPVTIPGVLWVPFWRSVIDTNSLNPSTLRVQSAITSVPLTPSENVTIVIVVELCVVVNVGAAAFVSWISNPVPAIDKNTKINIEILYFNWNNLELLSNEQL